MYINVAEIRQVLCYICITDMQKTHTQTARLVQVPQSWHIWIVSEIRHREGWGGRLAWWGAGKIIHTIHTHIDLEKFFQILAFFFKSRGVALFVCDVCGMRFEPPSLQEMYTASRYTLTLYLKQPW